jgi:hypothetical protein
MFVDGRGLDRRAGMTVVEMVVAVAIFCSIVATAIHPTIDASAGTEIVRADLFVRVDDALQAVADDIERGDLDPPTAQGDTLAYQVPIDPDGDGSYLDADGAVQFGMKKNGVSVIGQRATFKFVADRVLSEATLKFDLNGDGDLKDKFDQGHLVRVLPDGKTEQISGSWILQPNGNHGGDLDGDGVADPIFSITTGTGRTTATLDVTAAIRLADRAWIVTRTRRRVLCPNDVP